MSDRRAADCRVGCGVGGGWGDLLRETEMSAVHIVAPFYSVAGFFVGLLIGLTGVGGGSLMTPILILLFGIHPASAVGTDLVYAAVTKTAGTLVHGYNRSVDWRVVARLAAGSLPATALTIFTLSYFELNSPLARLLITATLTVALVITALSLIFRKEIVARHATRVGGLSQRRIAALTVATGAVLGGLVSISSVGAGAIGVMALVLLYPNLPMARIVGSDIAHAVPLTLAAGVGHWFLGSIDFGILAALLLGSVPGILIGSYATGRVPETALRLILAGTLIIVATKLSLDLYSHPSGLVTATTKRAHP